jgi:hypothetical protein
MIFVVNGLRVALEPSLHCIGAPLCDGPFDVTWRVARVNHPSKAAAEGAILPDGLYGSLVDRDGSIWTRLGTFFSGHLLSNFFVSADGRLVNTEAFQRIDDRDLFGLFVGPVMRAIFCNMGLASFHAAALAKEGGAVLIMGGRGAGKSSLAGAMQQQGWQLLADDLTRVKEHNGSWHAAMGHAQLAMRPDTARALGYCPETMQRRWVVRAANEGNKFILPCPPASVPDYGAPVRAMFLLSRKPTRTLRYERIPPVEQMRMLVNNMTADAEGNRVRPSAEAGRAVAGLLRQAAVGQLTISDRLGDIADMAAELDKLVNGHVPLPVHA